MAQIYQNTGEHGGKSDQENYEQLRLNIDREKDTQLRLPVTRTQPPKMTWKRIFVVIVIFTTCLVIIQSVILGATLGSILSGHISREFKNSYARHTKEENNNTMIVPSLNRCLQCSKVFSPKDCTRVTVCSHEELCHTQETDQFGNTFFSMGCLSKAACSEEYIFGRRHLMQTRNEKCHQCCQGENCNRNLCETDNSAITTKQPSLTTNNNGFVQCNALITEPSMQPLEPTGTPDQLSRDCLELYNSNITTNGIYRISPDRQTEFLVYCDMDEGGWTVIQRHSCKQSNFTRGWKDYVKGFGDLHGDFWLGLEFIHLLTNPPCDVILEGVPVSSNQTAKTKYSKFTVDGSVSNYAMHVTGSGILDNLATSLGWNYEGGFAAHDNRPFQTYDHLNSNGCATSWRGGWWFWNCWYVFLNGDYNMMDFKAKHPGGRVKSSQMKVRRV